MLLEKMNKGCTLYPAKSGYEKKGVWKRYNDVIYSVFTRLELANFHTELTKVDPDALVITQNIKDIKGAFETHKNH